MESISNMFHELGLALTTEIDQLPIDSPKITKGENYLHMPYVVLDYPKIRDKHFPIVLRTLFWWGNYYSLNVILKKDLLVNKAIKLDAKIYLQNDDNLWNNQVKSGYTYTQTIDPHAIKGEYIRIAKILPITNQSLVKEGLDWYKQILDQLLRKD